MERGHPFDYMQTDKISSLQSTLSTFWYPVESNLRPWNGISPDKSASADLLGITLPYNALPVDVASGSCPEVGFEEIDRFGYLTPGPEGEITHHPRAVA
jgi:hypothetical protein